MEDKTKERGDAGSYQYVINRSAHTEENFRTQIAGPELKIAPPTVRERFHKCLKKCNKSTVEKAILKLFPILTWLRNYEVRNWLPGDLVAGITVGVVHIPQSMAFSLLAGLPPVFGLYTSFYPVILYTLMGTSRHISVGTFAVTSLLTQSVVIRLVPDNSGMMLTAANGNISTAANTTAEMLDNDSRRVIVASSLMFLMGIFQLSFGLLRLGFITTYLSEPLIQAFTTGAAFQVITSQTPSVFGIMIMSSTGVGSFFRNWVSIFGNLPNTNVATLVISIVCFIFLIAGREVNKRFREKMKIPLPTEVIVVIFATIASHFGMFKENFQVNIVDNIPTGFPPPQLPDFSILGQIVGDAFAVAVVGFAISISLAKMYGQKHGYPIDSNQELLAYGVSNIIPSFFSCFPNAAALARCVIQENTGGKTQVVGIVSVIVVLITILVIGPLLEPLPRAVLGSIIIVGLFGIVQQLFVLKTIYKQSKLDFIVWLFTLSAVVVLGVDLGLLASVVFSLFTVIVRTQFPNYEILGNVGGTDVYRDCATYTSVIPYKRIVIFKFYSSVYYANKDYFKKKLIKTVGIDPDVEITRRKKLDISSTLNNKSQPNPNIKKIESITKLWLDLESNTSEQDLRKNDTNCCKKNGNVTELPHTVIIDCAAFSFIDLVGAKMLKAMNKSFQEIGISFFLANVSCYIRSSLSNVSFYDEAGHDSEFVSVHDAVIFAQAKEKERYDLDTTTQC